VPPAPNPPGSDNVLVEHGEDSGASGDTRDTPRNSYGPLPQPGPGEDEQLRPASGSPVAQHGDLPGAAPPPAPTAGGLGGGTSLPSTTASSPAWPHEDEALNAVDQAPVNSWQDPAGTSPAPPVREAPSPEEPPVALLPQSQSPSQEHVTGSLPAPPGLGMVPSMAAEPPSTPPTSSRAPRRSSYAGLNGRYFQLQSQDPAAAAGDPAAAAGDPVEAAGDPAATAGDPAVAAGDPAAAAGDPMEAAGDPVEAAGDPTVAGDATAVAGDPTVARDPVGTVTQPSILALEAKGAAANAVETWSIPHAGTYSPSNAVEEEIGPGE